MLLILAIICYVLMLLHWNSNKSYRVSLKIIQGVSANILWITNKLGEIIMIMTYRDTIG